jgi:hypothetical protein
MVTSITQQYFIGYEMFATAFQSAGAEPLAEVNSTETRGF